MKKFKKIFAVLLTLAMVLGMGMTSFAGTQPADGDKAAVTVGGIDNKATLHVYQIIDGDYQNGAFLGYKWAVAPNDNIKVGDKVTFENDNVVGLDDQMITKLAKNLNSSNLTAFTNGSELEVGTWMVIATPNEGVSTVYNPMIVSVYYTVNGVVVDSVSATDSWQIGSTPAYVKSTNIPGTVDKVVDENDKDAAVGDTIHYTLSGVIPSYSAEYDNTTLKYDLIDKIVNGLEYVQNDVAVTIGTEKATVDPANYTISYTEDEKSFTVSFKPEYIRSLAGIVNNDDREVFVKYAAKVTEDARTKVGENEVSINYSRTPGENVEGEKKTEYTYTFGFDGVLNKVNEKDELLPNAEFKLYKTADCSGDAVATYTTGADGKIKFNGLDGDVTYYLQESKAPNGYTLNDEIFTVAFSNIEYNKAEVSYDVTITGEDGRTVASSSIASYAGEPAQAGGKVVNTTITSLPGTGGIGTTIFTIGGCAIMIIAAALYFASRRKAAK